MRTGIVAGAVFPEDEAHSEYSTRQRIVGGLSANLK